MGIEEVKNYAIEKLKELFLLLNNFSGQFLSWFDKVFPPDTRKDKINHWFHVALPFLIVTMFFAVISYCCYCCCCRGGGRGRGRMMKAPGRNCRMQRSTFESNPRGYFRNLRSYPGDQLV
uniref:Putative ovule protein n=1 Tax=Solanum chacoense TaxID=4108 RepID=A0A0V0GUD1_SOLCH